MALAMKILIFNFLGFHLYKGTITNQSVTFTITTFLYNQ